jgi:hypothetical protein
MKYVFMSFASPHTGKNLGCCIIQVENPEDANEKSKELGLMPKEDNHAQGYVLNEDTWQEEGMDLNRFYSREEMTELGHKKETVRIR